MVDELLKNYLEKKFNYQKEKERLEKQIRNAHARLTKHERKYPRWPDILVKPICEEIAKRENLALDKDESYPTFGCRCECPIFFHNDKGECVGGITFTLSGDTLYYDTGRKLFNCDRTSIAGLNGFDNESKPVPNTIEEIIEKCLYKK